MNRLPSLARLLGITALLLVGGCSWFKHKPAQAGSEGAEAVAAAEATAAAEASAAAEAEAATEAQEASAATDAAGTLAEDFYVMHQRFGNSGLPNAGSMNAYNAFLCPRLSALIVDARQRQQQFAAAHPEDKPPLVDGDLFSSLVEGPESVKARETVLEGDSARVTLAMSHGDGDRATKWNDTMVLIRDDGIWCIDDVEYQGQWPFAHRGRLSDALKADF